MPNPEPEDARYLHRMCRPTALQFMISDHALLPDADERIFKRSELKSVNVLANKYHILALYS